MVIPFPICLKCVLCVKKIMVCRFPIFPLTIENDEFVLYQSAFVAFQVPIGARKLAPIIKRLSNYVFF